MGCLLSVLAGRDGSAPEQPGRTRFALLLSASARWASLFLPGHLWVVATEPWPAHLVIAFVIYLLTTWTLMARMIFVGRPRTVGSHGASCLRLIPLLLTLLLGVWSVYRTGIAPVIAESYAKAGLLSMQQREVDASIALLQRAEALQPQQDRYVALLADAYLQKAKTSFPPDPWLRRSQELFLEAARMTPPDPDHLYNLGTLHLTWAALVQPWGSWRSHLDTAIEYYLESVRRRSPQHRLRARERLVKVFIRPGLDPDQAAREVDQRLPGPSDSRATRGGFTTATSHLALGGPSRFRASSVGVIQ